MTQNVHIFDIFRSIKIMQQQKLNHDGIISIEQQILKTPMEIYKRSFRNSQKLLERELQNVIAYLAAEREKDQAGLEKIIARLETLQNRVTAG